MKPVVSTQEHYDRLAESGNGRNDPPFMQDFMARWDGPAFFSALGETRPKDLLEVGIGCGRIARQVLKRGCRSLTGLDISPITIAAAREDLAEYSNIELLNIDICDFVRRESYDAAYSVLTFMHVQDKRRALQNMVDSLRSGGDIVLSIDNPSDSLDFGPWTVALYPWAPELYAEALTSIGCQVAEPFPLIDNWITPQGNKSDTYGQKTATLIRARKW